MFRYLLSDNDIDVTGEYGLDVGDMTFIEEIIAGTKEKHRKGRDRSKFFLYGESASRVDHVKLLSLKGICNFSICNIV